MNDKVGTYHALWFVKKDLKEEKSKLLDSMRDMSLQFVGNKDDDYYKEWLTEFSERVEEINRILLKIDCNMYTLPEMED